MAGRSFVSSGGRLAHILLSREAVNIHAPASTGVLNRNAACVCMCVCCNYVRVLPSGRGTLESFLCDRRQKRYWMCKSRLLSGQEVSDFMKPQDTSGILSCFFFSKLVNFDQ